jgi:hypothetical protein
MRGFQLRRKALHFCGASRSARLKKRNQIGKNWAGGDYIFQVIKSRQNEIDRGCPSKPPSQIAGTAT